MKTYTNESPCPVCSNTKIVTHHHRIHISTAHVPRDTPKTGPSISRKVYPCPECSTPQNTVAVAQAHHRFSPAGIMPGFEKKEMECAAKEASDALLDFIRRAPGVINVTFEKTGHDEITATATMAVVTDEHASLIERFVGSRVLDAVQNAARIAIDNIRMWGVNYVGECGAINKDDAVRFVNEAAHRVDR